MLAGNGAERPRALGKRDGAWGAGAAILCTDPTAAVCCACCWRPKSLGKLGVIIPPWASVQSSVSRDGSSGNSELAPSSPVSCLYWASKML